MPISDSVFLLPERREQPMHVGSLQLFRLPAGAGPDWVRTTYEAMLDQTEVRTLFRRRPSRSLRSLGAWSWVIDDDVDLEHHVRHSALPRPGRVRELLALTSRLHGTLLDRQRPLWEMHVIEGLEGDRFAIYTKIHHSLLDGVAALRLLSDSLSTSSRQVVPAMWVPRQPEERTAEPAGLGDLPASAARAAGELAGVVPLLGRRAVGSILSPGAPVIGTPPRTMLNVAITGSRRYAAQGWSLERIKAVARKSDATVNDVVLAMCAAALRSYLRSFDALPDDPLIAMTPVSLRRPGEDAGDGNAVGAILASLATDVADPGDRLDAIKESMNRGKQSLAGLSPLQATAVSALLLAPLALSAFGPLGRLAPPPFNLVISNVPGPRKTLYLNGAALDGLYPLSIPLDGQALNVTVTSYRDSMGFGLTGDRRALPHLQRLLSFLDTGLDELAALTGV